MAKDSSGASRIATPLGSFGGGIGDPARLRRQGMSVRELYLRRKRFLEESGILLETAGKPVDTQRKGPARRART
jgi:hypothetical protein